ncbi:MAG: nucleotidyl transferase AbiEii/AbiGii toxin family protein [Raoultibacter sp.]
MAYPLATTLAEKLETVISRDVSNTRPRDYYDLYMLWLMRRRDVKSGVLKAALVATSENRGTAVSMDNYREVMKRVCADDNMLGQWKAYAYRYPYVEALTLSKTCETVVEIMETIGWKSITTDRRVL